MATGEPAYNPSIGGSNPTPPVTIDGTGLTTTVPLLVKNGKANSGVEVQVTGTVASGFELNNSAGVLKGALGIAAATNDWITGTAVSDIALNVVGSLLLGVAGAAIATVGSTGVTIASGKKLIVDSSNSLTTLALQISGDANTGLAQISAADGLSLVNGGVESLRTTGTSAGAQFGVNVAAANDSGLTLQVNPHTTGGNAYVAVKGVATGSRAILECKAHNGAAIDVSAESDGVAGTVFGTNKAATVSVVSTANTTMFVGNQGNADVILGSNDVERLRLDSLGNVSVGSAALATNATDGFLYIPTCAGTPTGTPTAKTGRVAIIYDTTNNKFYVYNGAFKGGTTPGTWI